MPSSDFGSSHFAFVQAEVVRDLVPHRLLHQLLELRGGASRTFVQTLVDRNFVRERKSFTRLEKGRLAAITVIADDKAHPSDGLQRIRHGAIPLLGTLGTFTMLLACQVVRFY
jgi:hypothetical protein